MEVLLINTIPRVGQKGQIINVAKGYARNFLFPRNLAIPATEGAKRHLDLMKDSWEKQELKERKNYELMVEKLDNQLLKITKKAGESGRLFGSVTSNELSEEISKQIGIEVNKKLVVADHIKELGEHQITVRFTGDLKANLRVLVLPQEA